MTMLYPCNTRKVIQTRKVKLLLSRLFFLVIFKQRINDYALYFKTFHSRISSQHALVNFNSFLTYW